MMGQVEHKLRVLMALVVCAFAILVIHVWNVHDGYYFEYVPPWDNPALQDHGEMHNGWQEGSPLQGHRNEYSYLDGDHTMRDWVVCAYDRNRDGDATAARAGRRNVNTSAIDWTVDAFRWCNTNPPVKRNNAWHQTGWATMDRDGDIHRHWLNGRSRH